MLKRHLSSAQIIIFGFAGTILMGTFLLMLPISSVSGMITPFSDSLFTATSAVCVTGLVVQDTATYWSMFGQFVILILIQIGGLGVVTIAVATALVSGRKIGLMQRSTLKEAISAQKVGGIVRLTGFILKATFLIELIGAILLASTFFKDFGLKGIWFGIFHSVSAFCNAGFDLMGTVSPFSSLTAYSAQPVVNITVMLLIIIGGIGFLVWEDIKTNKWHIKKYRMQSKVVLSVTTFLIIVPFIYFYLNEFNHIKSCERIYTSLFQT
ncbi:MAG: Trk family potassium uptake protein, partial [Firmicutes bacterium]|nr:Trk family potassium uptake protein [Bacillota bacterium]